MLAFIPLLGLLALWAGLIVMWLTGLVAAINGRRKPLSILGANFEAWFKGAFI